MDVSALLSIPQHLVWRLHALLERTENSISFISVTPAGPVPLASPSAGRWPSPRIFVHYEDYGTVLPGGGDDAQDQFIFAGTVFEAEGRYHAMYTGYNRDYEKQGKKPQILMKAESDDLIHWQKNGESWWSRSPAMSRRTGGIPSVFLG